MKKIIIFNLTLIILVLLTGCTNHQLNKIVYKENEETLTIQQYTNNFLKLSLDDKNYHRVIYEMLTQDMDNRFINMKDKRSPYLVNNVNNHFIIHNNDTNKDYQLDSSKNGAFDYNKPLKISYQNNIASLSTTEEIINNKLVITKLNITLNEDNKEPIIDSIDIDQITSKIYKFGDKYIQFIYIQGDNDYVTYGMILEDNKNSNPREVISILRKL